MLWLKDRLMLHSRDLPEDTDSRTHNLTLVCTTLRHATYFLSPPAAATAFSRHVATGVRGCLVVLEVVL